MASNNLTLDESSGEVKRKRKIKFLPLPSTPKLDFSVHQGSSWSPRHGFRIRKSLWMWIAIGILFVSNVLYAVAFLTNRWGVLLVNSNKPAHGNVINANENIKDGKQNSFNISGRLKYEDYSILFPPQPDAGKNTSTLHSSDYHPEHGSKMVEENEKYWEFGLWECCRNDGFCLGTRWPAFYSATRAFAVLGLFGQILTLAWMIGHALDNLLEYDPCSMIALISLNIVTAIFVLLAVCAFGTRWPVEFKNDFHGTDTYLSYSFYLAVDTFILLVLSSVFTIVDLTMSWRKLVSYSRRNWATADEILGDEDEEDGIEEQSWNKISYM